MALPARNSDSGDLWPRLASAAVLAPLALAVAYVGSPAFEAALIAVAGVLAWEWTALCGSHRASLMRALLTLVAAAAVLLVATDEIWPAVIAIGAGTLVAAALEGDDAEGKGKRAWMAIGVVYIAVPMAALEWLRLAPHGRELVAWLLIVVWASDTVAYVFGRTFGGPKLAPSISPKKTWSGLAGAVIGAAAGGGFCALAFGADDAAGFALMAALFGLVGQGGDLMESAIKRRFGVKDTSRIIPGHGGLFDRLDAFMAVVVLAAAARAAGWAGGTTW
jgi:phosphatidate cytidylyltransferase